jgi:hypothetical protein
MCFVLPFKHAFKGLPFITGNLRNPATGARGVATNSRQYSPNKQQQDKRPFRTRVLSSLSLSGILHRSNLRRSELVLLSSRVQTSSTRAGEGEGKQRRNNATQHNHQAPAPPSSACCRSGSCGLAGWCLAPRKTAEEANCWPT